MPLKEYLKNTLILIAITVCLIGGMANAWDWQNTGKITAFAYGEDDLELNSYQLEAIIPIDNANLNKISMVGLNAVGASDVSLDYLTAFTLRNDDGSTNIYQNQVTQSLNLPDESIVKMGEFYTLNPQTGETGLTTKMSFTNPNTGTEFNMAEVDPNDPTKVIEEFIKAMDLGMSYERIQGLQYNVDVEDSELITKNGMDFEFSEGKNTEIRV